MVVYTKEGKKLQHGTLRPSRTDGYCQVGRISSDDIIIPENRVAEYISLNFDVYRNRSVLSALLRWFYRGWDGMTARNEKYRKWMLFVAEHNKTPLRSASARKYNKVVGRG